MTTQVLIGVADAVVGFPLTVSSKLLIGNLTAHSAPVTGQVTFSDNAGHILSVPLETPSLNPNEVRAIDLNRLKANAGIPLAYPSASLSLDTSGDPGAVMARVYGMSADGQMGFYWALENYAGRAYDESYWSTEGAWTTVLAVANFATTADTVKVTVTSNSGNVDLAPFKLQPGESRTLNLNDLARGSNFPKANSGGLRITGESPTSQLLVKEHLVNSALELATPFYGSAPFVSSVTFYNSSYTGYVGGDTVGTSSYRYWSDDIQDDGCPYGYSSDNSSIATIAKNGCVGVMTAVAGGTTNIHLSESDPYDGAGDYGEFDADAQATTWVPTSLSVVSKGLSSPNCPGSQNYGVFATITYQVLDQNSTAMAISGMTPFESGTWFDGSTLSNHQLGQPTNSQGQFIDTPVGACQNLPFGRGVTYTATQNITVTLNGTSYPVRTNMLTVSDTAGSPGFGHGSITNGSDITVSR